jgi:hypothetical protein
LKHACLLLSLLWLPSLAAHAQVQPIWSLPLGETAEDPRPLAIEDARVLSDGSAVFRGYVSGQQPSMRLWPDAATTRSQTYQDRSGEILGDHGGRLLVSRIGASPGELEVLGQDGHALWTRKLRASHAQFFANGDVLVKSLNQLMRLNGSDGAIRWKLELLDLHPLAESSDFRVGDNPDVQIDLAGRLRVKAQGAQFSTDLPWQAALDPLDGSIRWSRRFGPEAPPENQPGCSTFASDGTVMWLCQRSRFAAGTWIYQTEVRVYRHRDGLRWVVALPERPSNYNYDYAVALASQQLHLGMLSSGGLRLMSLDLADGALRWEQVLASGRGLKLLTLANDDVLYSIHRQDGSGGLTTIGRHHGSSGSSQWTVDVAQSLQAEPVWRAFSDSLGIASVTGTSEHQRARLESRSLATGELLASAEDAVTSRYARPYAALATSTGYCHAALSASDAVTLQCLSGMAGVPVWTRTIAPPAAGDAVTGFWLAPLAADRIVLTTRYTRILGDAATVLFAAKAIDSAAGTPLWEQIDLPVQPIFLGTPDGGALMSHATCPLPPGCAGFQQLLDRISGTDGNRLWSRPNSARPLAQVDDQAVLYQASPQTPEVRTLDARTGADAWVAALPQGTLGTVGAVITPRGDLVIENARNIGTTRRIEVRGLDRSSGGEDWLVIPTIPSNFISDSVLWPLDDGRVLVTANLRNASGQLVPWQAAIDAATGGVQWESVAPSGGDPTRTMLVVGADPAQGLWLSSQRNSRIEVQRKAMAHLNPLDGRFGGEHQFASSGDLAPDDPSSLAIPERLLADGSALARAWREVDGLSLAVLQRWPAPTGPDVDVVLELDSPSPVLGHGPSAMVDLRIENRSAHPVAGLRPAMVETAGAHSEGIIGCTAVTGAVRCIPPTTDHGAFMLDLGPGAVARVRYEVSGAGYRPAASTNNGTAYFHIDLPYNVGDDLGDNTVAVEIWLGGTSNGFE